MSKSEGPFSMRNQLISWFRKYAGVLLIYLLATWFTDADFMGDTVDYVGAIVAMNHGRNYYFWEFAHLLWRPFGWVVSQIATPLTQIVVGKNEYVNVTSQLVLLSWLAGLLSVFTMYKLVDLLVKRAWIANVVTIGLIFSYGFLNHAQTGTSYLPGLSLLFLGLYILIRDGNKPEVGLRTAVLAGAALAGSVFLWVTYVLAVPAALLSPLIVFGFDKARLRLVILTSLVCAVIIGLTYAAVLAHIGIYDVTKLRAWIAFSSEAAYVPRGGLPRFVFGLARSFINMGNDGVLFKLYLSHDPYNPIPLSSLVRLSLWKLALFYVCWSAIVFNSLRTSFGRRLVGLLIVGSLPVAALALFLEGGAVDRYLPMYPFMFLVLACSLGNKRSLPLLNYVGLIFIIVSIVTNVSVLATPAIQRQQEQSAARISKLQPQLKPQSVVITLNLRDELVNFNRTFPLHPINLNTEHPLHVGSVIAPGAIQVGWWRKDFATGVLKVWNAGGDVWLSTRVLSSRPKADWGWVESDDPRVSWKDIYTFFSELETDRPIDGEDSFVLLLRSPKNEEAIRRFAQ